LKIDVMGDLYGLIWCAVVGLLRSRFAKLVELFDRHSVSFVSVTQQFNTTTSMGRLTLNVLLSFAQFEREVTSERNVENFPPIKEGHWLKGTFPSRL